MAKSLETIPTGDSAPKPPSAEKPMSLTQLLEQGSIDEAIERISAVTYNGKEGMKKTSDLKRVILHLARDEASSLEVAIKVLDIVAPQPDTSDQSLSQFDREYFASYYDFIVQDLVIVSLQRKDFASAEEIVERMDDWYVGSAMDGDDLLELAYQAKDPAILASVWALIAKRWNSQGRAKEDIPQLVKEADFDPEMVTAINGWLKDAGIRYRIKN